MVRNQCLELDKRDYLVSPYRRLYQRPKASYDKGSQNLDSVFLNGLTAQQKLSTSALRKQMPSGKSVMVNSGEDTSTMKKYLTNGMPLILGITDKMLRLLPTASLVGGCSDDDSQYHDADTKSPGDAGAFVDRYVCSVIATGEYGKQMQQMYENIENTEVQTHRRTNVVGLAALNNAAGVKQYQA